MSNPIQIFGFRQKFNFVDHSQTEYTMQYDAIRMPLTDKRG